MTALKTYMESALVRYNGDLLSSQRSEPQQLNAHPSSDQLRVPVCKNQTYRGKVMSYCYEL